MRLIVIIGALVIALFAVLALGNIFEEEKPQEVVMLEAPTAAQPIIVQKNILVAKQDIPIGTQLNNTYYDVKPMAEQAIPPGAIFVDDPAFAKVDELITNTSIVTNQPILSTMLRNPNDPSYIAGQLAAGMRAVTIKVSNTDVLSGLVLPGDKVDVIYTHEVNSNNISTASLKAVKADSVKLDGSGSGVKITEVLIPNLKVLAVDKRVAAAGNNAEPQATPQSVTLEVNLRDAQKLMLAEKIGDLSLALRSIKDKDKFDIVRPTAEQDLTRSMPPAYFTNLYDSDAAYDFDVVNPYTDGGSTYTPALGKVKLYRGAELQEVEVLRK